MNRKNILIGAAMILLLLSSLFQVRATINLKAERDSYKRNTETLLSEIDTFRTKNNNLTAKVNDLELTNRDFKKLLEQDADQIKSLRKRNEELDRLVKSEVNTRVEFETVIKEVPVYRDSTLSTLKKIEWSDLPWASFDAVIDPDGTISATMTHHEELDVIVFLEYKKFLWWKTKVLGGNVQVVSHSPYTTSLEISSVKIK